MKTLQLLVIIFDFELEFWHFSVYTLNVKRVRQNI